MTGIQIIGRSAVMKRFEASGCETWALYQGKQFIVGGIGAEELEEWLKSFEASGTTATYMIRVYDGDEKPTSSNGNTDYVACIGFKLVDTYEGMGIAGHSIGLMERIKGLEKKLEERENDDDQENDLNSVIMGWLTDPVKLQQVAGVIKMFTGGPAPIEAAPAIAGIGNIDAKEPQTVEPVDINRLAAALDVLGAKDPKIIEHLEKLSKLATSDPELFKSVISKLDLL